MVACAKSCLHQRSHLHQLSFTIIRSIALYTHSRLYHTYICVRKKVSRYTYVIVCSAANKVLSMKVCTYIRTSILQTTLCTMFGVLQEN